MRLVEYIEGLDIKDINIDLNILKKFSLSPLTKQKLKKFFSDEQNIYNFFYTLFSSYNQIQKDELLSLFFRFFFKEESIEIEENNIFLIKHLWIYNNLNSIPRAVFFDDVKRFFTKYFRKEFCINKKVHIENDFFSSVFQVIEKSIILIESREYKNIKSSFSKKLIYDLKNVNSNEDIILFSLKFLENISIIDKEREILSINYSYLKVYNSLNISKKKSLIFDFLIYKYFPIVFYKYTEKIGFFLTFLTLSKIKVFDMEKVMEYIKDTFIIEDKKLNSIYNRYKEVISSLGIYRQEGNEFFINMIFEDENKNEEEIEDNFFYVMDNFEILVSSKYPNDKLAFLGRFTNLKKEDNVLIYEINKKSIIKGINRGLSIDNIINFLKENSLNPIPQNIIHSIYEWGNYVNLVSIEEGKFLVIKDRMIYEKIISLLESSSIEDFSNFFILKIKKDDVLRKLEKAELIFIEKENKINEDNIDIQIKKEEDTFLKKFYNTNRLFKFSIQDKIKILKYAYYNNLDLEIMISTTISKKLKDKKIKVMVVDFEGDWISPDITFYIYELKREYTININEIERLRIIFDNSNT